MDANDAKKIADLQNQGYLVLVSDPHGETFGERYMVYQRHSAFRNLKSIITDDDGNVVGAQG